METLAGLKGEAADHVRQQREALRRVIRDLDRLSELGGEEVESSRLLCEQLHAAGFAVERGAAGIPTAFVARAGTNHGPTIAFLLEYDALPTIGHGCGHDASGAASLAAALAVKSCLAQCGQQGRVLAVGTPGEENLSCKIKMVERGVFQGVDAAMMVHAFDRWLTTVDTMALDAREYTFEGAAAHAAGAPEKGINALDAVALTFHGVNCLRQHIPDGCRVHGIVTAGGEAPNIVPAHAQCRFYVRAPRRSYLNTLTPRIDRCAQAGALATGCSLDVRTFEASVDDIVLNRPFLDLFAANLLAADLSVALSSEVVPLGSTDAGNLSHVVPTIHPLGGFAPLGTVLHTREFAEAMLTDDALDAVCTSAIAMAHTAIDLMLAPGALDAVRGAFRETS